MSGSPFVGRSRRVSCALPRDPRFAKLTHFQRALLYYVKTGPQTDAVPGLSRFSVAVAAEDLTCTSRAIEKGLLELQQVGFVDRWDPKTRVLWIENEILEQPPHSESNIRSWKGAWSLVPPCPERDAAREYLFAYCATRGPEFASALASVVGAEVQAEPPTSGPASGPPLDVDQDSGSKTQTTTTTKTAAPAGGDGVRPPDIEKEIREILEDRKILDAASAAKTMAKAYAGHLNWHGEPAVPIYVLIDHASYALHQRMEAGGKGITSETGLFISKFRDALALPKEAFVETFERLERCATEGLGAWSASPKKAKRRRAANANEDDEFVPLLKARSDP